MLYMDKETNGKKYLIKNKNKKCDPHNLKHAQNENILFYNKFI